MRRRSCRTIALVVAAVGMGASLCAPAALGAPTWLSPETIRGTTGDSPTIAMNARGDTVAAWYEVVFHDSELWTAFRPAGGPWQSAQDVGLAAGGQSTPIAPRSGLDDSGNATLLYGSYIGGASLYASLRLATGAVVAPPADLTLSAQGGFSSDPTPSLAVDSQGDALVVASDGASRLDVRLRAAATGAWSDPKTFTQAGRTISGPQGGFDRGNVVVTWISTGSDGSALYEAARNVAGVWSGPTPIRPAGGATISALRLALSPAGTGVLAFQEDEGGATNIRALARDAAGVWREAQPTLPEIPGGAFPSASPAVTLDAAGAAYLVFRVTVDPSQPTQIKAERMSPDGTWGSLESLGAGSDPRIAADAAGNATALWLGTDGRVQGAERVAGGVFQPAKPISDPGAASPDLALDSAGDGAAVWVGGSGVQAAGLDGTGPALPAPSIPTQVDQGRAATFTVGAATDTWSALAGPPSWDLGDGTRLSGASVVHAYAAPGDFQVTVSQADAAGNVATRAGRVHVLPSAAGGGAGGGAGPGPGRKKAKPPSPITLTTASLTGRYRQSRLTGGTLALRGRSTSAVKALVSLKHVGRLPVGASAAGIGSRLTLRPGAFRLRLPVKANLIPGRYILRITTPGTAVVGRKVSLAGPPEGVVVRAYPTAILGGPPVTRLQGSPHALFARFVFAATPTKGRLRLIWYPPGGGAPTVVPKPITPNVDALIRTGDALPKGVWRCVLRVGAVDVKEIRVPVG